MQDFADMRRAYMLCGRAIMRCVDAISALWSNGWSSEPKCVLDNAGVSSRVRLRGSIVGWVSCGRSWSRTRMREEYVRCSRQLVEALEGSHRRKED
jgi:hypothetical protein